MTNSLLTYIFLSVPAFCFSTCIVIIKRKTEIIVGADSKRTVYKQNLITGEVTETTEDSHCKIHRAGKYYFAISGYDDQGQKNLAFQVSYNARSLSELIEKFSASMKSRYEDIIETLRTTNRQRFINRFMKDDISKTSFFCISQNGPEVITLAFKTLNKPNEKTRVKVSKFENEDYTFLGYYDHIKNLPRMTAYVNVEPIELIKLLIRLEIKNHPKEIGEPIDLLVLSIDGEKWIEKKKNCL